VKKLEELIIRKMFHKKKGKKKKLALTEGEGNIKRSLLSRAIDPHLLAPRKLSRKYTLQ